MIHTLQLGVASEAALDFWEQRLAAERRAASGRLRFEDYDGLALELVVADAGNPPLRAAHPEIPAEHAILGIEGARAYSEYAGVEERLLTEVLGFATRATASTGSTAPSASFRWAYDPRSGARVGRAGRRHRPPHRLGHARTTSSSPGRRASARPAATSPPVQDRDYFLSIYFREPRGVLFEIATMSPGFAIDEDPDHLGEELRLPEQHEHLRAQLEARAAAGGEPAPSSRGVGHASSLRGLP